MKDAKNRRAGLLQVTGTPERQMTCRAFFPVSRYPCLEKWREAGMRDENRTWMRLKDEQRFDYVVFTSLRLGTLKEEWKKKKKKDNQIHSWYFASTCDQFGCWFCILIYFSVCLFFSSMLIPWEVVKIHNVIANLALETGNTATVPTQWFWPFW